VPVRARATRTNVGFVRADAEPPVLLYVTPLLPVPVSRRAGAKGRSDAGAAPTHSAADEYSPELAVVAFFFQKRGIVELQSRPCTRP
jgi:hypothetical protein